MACFQVEVEEAGKRFCTGGSSHGVHIVSLPRFAGFLRQLLLQEGSEEVGPAGGVENDCKIILKTALYIDTELEAGGNTSSRGHGALRTRFKQLPVLLGHEALLAGVFTGVKIGEALLVGQVGVGGASSPGLGHFEGPAAPARAPGRIAGSRGDSLRKHCFSQVSEKTE